MLSLFFIFPALLLTALPVRQRARIHILLKYLMEIVRIREAEPVGYIVDRLIRLGKKRESSVDSDSVYVIDRCLTYALLEHLGEVVGRDGDHLCESIDIYLLPYVGIDIVNNRTQSHYVVIYHAVELILRAAVEAKKLCHYVIYICSYRQFIAHIL